MAFLRPLAFIVTGVDNYRFVFDPRQWIGRDSSQVPRSLNRNPGGTPSPNSKP